MNFYRTKYVNQNIKIKQFLILKWFEFHLLLLKEHIYIRNVYYMLNIYHILKCIFIIPDIKKIHCIDNFHHIKQFI